MLLNRKRGGELQRLPLHLYQNVPEHQSYEEFNDAISQTEKILMKKFKRVVTRGKRDRGVPVLFTTDVQQHLKELIALRDNFVKKENIYLFPTLHHDTPITGYKVMQKHAKLSGAKNPEAITSTRLRKHLATMSQILELSPNDIEQLATFMGHTKDVHKQVYRLPDDVFQTAKIAKLLVLMESGQAGQYKGKTLDEIDLDLEEDVNEESSDEEAIETREEILEQQEPSTSSVPPKKKRILVPWTPEQKKLAKLYFKVHIQNKVPPKKGEYKFNDTQFVELPNYYLATEENQPGQRHLYVVRDPSTDDPRRVESSCITCDLGGALWSSRYLYGNCTHFSAQVSTHLEHSNSSFYVLHCEGPGLPLASLHNAITHKFVKILYDTRPSKWPILEKLAMPTKKSFEVPLPQGSRAQVQLLLPPSWREELRDAAYPVLVEVNGRPGGKSVTEQFKVDWGTYMSSHCDVVYVKLDVRGARGQIDRSLYRQLGGVEVQDQVTVLEYLLENHKYLDKTRVGLWGWGYGGYVTAMVLGLGNQQKVFKCGIAVSPIADWLYYNAAFTERILGLPTENYKGYVEADATQRARNVPKKSFFLIHGMADLTAPYQHGVSLANALTRARVLFRYQCYADEGHQLDGVIEHVYSSMQQFFEECLNLDTDETAKEREERKEREREKEEAK
ncbi:hypothetical protein JTB14_037241 [Gonioctena quinquepunctata]|nr:hypothetical protein JTB14_037241 [Gonioctena quinquepunctata]